MRVSAPWHRVASSSPGSLLVLTVLCQSAMHVLQAKIRKWLSFSPAGLYQIYLTVLMRPQTSGLRPTRRHPARYPCGSQHPRRLRLLPTWLPAIRPREFRPLARPFPRRRLVLMCMTRSRTSPIGHPNPSRLSLLSGACVCCVTSAGAQRAIRTKYRKWSVLNRVRHGSSGWRR